MAPTSLVSQGVAEQFFPVNREKVEAEDASCAENQAAAEEWVGCDGCSKWRKVPVGFQFDRNKSFFCNMIETLTCETPEEKWDDEEEFVDDDIVDDRSGERNDSSRSTTPRGGGSKRSSGSAAKEQTGVERATGKRKCFRPSAYADGEGAGDDRWRRSRRTAHGDEARAGHTSRDDSAGQRANRGRAEGPAGGVQGMSRLDAVVRVLKATGKALHYNIITRQALQQGIIRFTGSQGTAGESMKAFLNKTIRENKTAAIVNMGKGVYGLKEWGRSGAAKEGPAVPKEEVLEAHASTPSRSTSAEAEEAGEEESVMDDVEVANASEATPSETNESEEDAVSAPASPADTSLANNVFPRVGTPTELGGGVGALGGPGMGSGIYSCWREESGDGLESGRVHGLGSHLGLQWSQPQSPSEFFSWSNGEYCT